jgi:hypothetical protein
MAIGYRQKDTAGPLYHPERDYAYITPTLLRQAIENMEQPAAEEMRAWQDKEQITVAEIVAVTTALAEAQRDFVNAADPVKNLEQALQRRGFYDVRLPARLSLFAHIGEVVVGAWFLAVREVTAVGEESPAQNEMCRFSSTVREFAAQKGALVHESNATIDHLRYQQDVLRFRLSATKAKLDAVEKELSSLRQQVENDEPDSPPAKPKFDWLSSVLSLLPLFIKGRSACQSTGCTKTPKNSGKS